MASHTKIWTTKLINETLKRMDAGMPADTSCFWNQDTGFRQADINFQMTHEETEEFIRCSEDVIYFADKYCYAMTDEGIVNIKLRDYQKDMLRDFQKHRFVVLLASRQIGKCLTYDTKIQIYDQQKKRYSSISIGNLYYTLLQQKRSLRFLEKIKWRLWQFYDRLN